MLSSGVTDIATKRYDFCGARGFKPRNETRFFLVRHNFSVTRMRAIAGNRQVKYHLLSRKIKEFVSPLDAVKEQSSEEKDFVDGRVATPYGVSTHVYSSD